MASGDRRRTRRARHLGPAPPGARQASLLRKFTVNSLIWLLILGSHAAVQDIRYGDKDGNLEGYLQVSRVDKEVRAARQRPRAACRQSSPSAKMYVAAVMPTKIHAIVRALICITP